MFPVCMGIDGRKWGLAHPTGQDRLCLPPLCSHMCCWHVNTHQQQVSDCKKGGFPAPSCVGIAGTGPTIPSVFAPPALSSACFSKPICSAFAIITCLPSLWHIRGRRQASLTPLSPSPPPPLTLHAPISAPTSPVHWGVQVASCPTLFLSQGWKQRSAAAMRTI